MKKPAEKTNRRHTGGFMNRSIFNGLVYGIIIAMILLPVQAVWADLSGCDPCYSWNGSRCVWQCTSCDGICVNGSCVANCDQSHCLTCKNDSCQSSCGSGLTCCPSSPWGSCCNPNLCQECVGGECKVCGGRPCESCVNGKCKVCDGNPNQVCCQGACTGSCYHIETKQEVLGDCYCDAYTSSCAGSNPEYPGCRVVETTNTLKSGGPGQTEYSLAGTGVVMKIYQCDTQIDYLGLIVCAELYNIVCLAQCIQAGEDCAHGDCTGIDDCYTCVTGHGNTDCGCLAITCGTYHEIAQFISHVEPVLSGCSCP
jgi:hypothetical protein